MRSSRPSRGGAALFVIPVFVIFYVLLAAAWQLPHWVAGVYLLLSAATFIAYAADKSAAARGSWRTPERTLHTLAVAGGWPGALLAQHVLRHKSAKPAFRRFFWGTVVINLVGLVLLASPWPHPLLQAL